MRLRDLVFAAGLLIPGCQTPSEPVPQQQARQSIDTVVKDALTYFQNKQYAKAQGLLEQHRDYQISNRSDLSPSGRCLLALTYTVNWKFSDAETQFWIVMQTYKKNTHTADNVGAEFSEFFKTKQYKQLEKMLTGYASTYPRLNAVLGFLKAAQKEYGQAADAFAKAQPYFDSELVNEYRAAFHSRHQQAASQNDPQTAIGYMMILEALNKPPATVKR